MKDRLKAIGMATIAVLMLPLTLPLIVIGFLWGHACRAIHLGTRTAELGSMSNALKEEGY